MIIFGHRARVGESKPLPGVVCSSCSKGNLSLATIFRYFHIYWIPFFPLQRSLAAACDHCKTQFTNEELKQYQTAVTAGNFKFDPIPKKYFTGLLMVSSVLGVCYLSVQRDSEHTKQYAAAPQAGDLCVVKARMTHEPKTVHVAWQLTGVDENAVEFRQAATGFSAASDAEKFALTHDTTMKNAYKPETLSMTRADFAKMLESGDLEKIVRRETIAAAPSKSLPTNMIEANLDAH